MHEDNSSSGSSTFGSNMNSNRPASGHGRRERATGNRKTAPACEPLLRSRIIEDYRVTYVEPVHCPFDNEPPTTSQYDPSGSVVVNVVDHSESSLLIATNPRAPGNIHANQSVRMPSPPTHATYRGQRRLAGPLAQSSLSYPRCRPCCGSPPCLRSPASGVGRATRLPRCCRNMCPHHRWARPRSCWNRRS